MAEQKDKKKLIMRIGVISIMILIMFFWALNIKNVLKSSENGTVKNQEEWESIQKDLSNTLSKMNTALDKINHAEDTATTSNSGVASSTATSTDSSMATSSPVASSSSSSLPVAPDISPVPEKTNSNCPSYINCMPTIGEARACRIPAGCEGITQIAY